MKYTIMYIQVIRCIWFTTRYEFMCMVYTHTPAHTQAHTHIHTHTHTYIYTHTHLYTYTHFIYTHAYTHIYTHTRTHAHIHKNTHIHLYIFSSTSELSVHTYLILFFITFDSITFLSKMTYFPLFKNSNCNALNPTNHRPIPSGIYIGN